MYWNSIIAIVAVTLLLYYWCVKNFNHWKKKNVPYVKPVPLFGNMWSFVRGKHNHHDLMNHIYTSLEGQAFGGFFEMREPCLMIRDPKLVTQITIKDFNNFHDRAVEIFFYPGDKKLNPLSSNLFAVKDEKWRTLRQKLSPVFTTNKLIGMQEQIFECVSNLKKIVDRESLSSGTEFKEVLMNYMINVIGSCAFGVDCRTNENSEFATMAKKAFLLRFDLKLFIIMISPKLLRILNIGDVPADVTQFFYQIVMEAVRLRAEQREKRKDFLQMMIDIMDQSDKEEFDEVDLASNAFIFFAAGFETTATTLCFVLHEITVNAEIQQKLRAEIKMVKDKHGGKITLESLKDLVYMDMVISETLRKDSPVAVLFRACTKDYVIPGTDVVIEEGTKVVIPVAALHNDPKYFPNPQKFDPERFTPENKLQRPSGCYVPFGEGPRYCIGVRFAQVAMKLALAEMVQNYEFTVCDKTDTSLETLKGSPLLTAKNGFWLKVTKL